MSQGFEAFLARHAERGEHPPRFLNARDLPQPKELGPSGRRLCRWCWSEVPRGCRAWCSDDCREEFYIRSSGNIVRWRVERRDRGICDECGADASKAERILRRLSRWATMGDREAVLLFRELWGAGFSTFHLWEADHIVPVAEGGGCCGLEGYRTLCRVCHTKASGQLRRRLNRQASPQMSLEACS